jgi:hypothetical protein
VTDPDLIGLFIRPLEQLGILYMITGGVASVIYGDPRFTRDIDVVLRLTTPDLDPLIAAYDDRDFYVPPREALEAETERTGGGHFNLIHRDTALRADVYLTGDDPLHAWALQRRQRIRDEQIEIWVAPIEYVILRKLEYFRASGWDHHLRDVAMMLHISPDLIDAPALAEWATRRGLEAVLQQASRFRPNEL